MSDSSRSYLRRKLRFPNDKRIADDEFMAAAIGDTEWLKHSLKEAKGQINFDKNGLSALHLSAIHGRLECLKLLIEKYKVDINLPSTTGWRAVHLCISNQTGKRALTCLQYLVTKKADLSIPNNDGITPVHQAASEGHVQCLKLLIQNGANIVGKDCRGHTPLDLAKLWGHKNCARLLAAELWHQDKDNVFKEMVHLKKLKMQQVLKEMEDQDEFQTARQYYGEKAFDEWLEKKNLPKSQTGPKTNRDEPEETTAKQETQKKDKKDSTTSAEKDLVEKGAKSSVSYPRRSILLSREERTPPSPSSTRRLTDVYDQGLYGDEHSEEAKSTQSAQKKLPDTWVNPETWKLALHPPKMEYVPNLPDEYPRDEYTMMPRTKNAPKYFDGKFGHSFLADEKPKTKKKSARKPNLPDDVVEKYMSKDPSLLERPILFKPVHMFDINKKKKFENEDQMKGEVSLHLCDDFSSFLYQRSLTDTAFLPQRSKASSSASSTSSSKTTTKLPHGLKQLHLRGGNAQLVK